MGDEDVIRRRLLIDGDGTGDDRRLNVLLKSFIKWCNTKYDSPAESQMTQDRMFAQLAQCEYAYAKSRLVASMSAAELENYENLSKQIERDIEKAKQDIEGTKAEFKEAKTVRKNRVEYEVLAKVINEQPDRKQTDEKLSQLRKELHSLEKGSSPIFGRSRSYQSWPWYSELGGGPWLVDLPSGGENNDGPAPPKLVEIRKLATYLNGEGDPKKEVSRQLDNKLELRRKQFHVLIASIHQLQLLLDENMKDEAMDTTYETFDDEDIEILSQKPTDLKMES